jgi:hypothetical protein
MKKKLLSFFIVTVALASIHSLVGFNDEYGACASNYDQNNKVVRQEYEQARQELSRVLLLDLDEASLLAVLHLFSIELQLVDKLLHAETGSRFDGLLHEKKAQLESATTTATYIYDLVMKFATNDSFFTGKKSTKKMVFQGVDKKNYLHRMKNILTDYRKKLLNKQQDVSKRKLGLSSEKYVAFVGQQAITDATPVPEQISMPTWFSWVVQQCFYFISSVWNIVTGTLWKWHLLSPWG